MLNSITIYIFGTGEYASELYKKVIKFTNVLVKGFVNTLDKPNTFCGIPVYGLDYVEEDKSFDYIIIGVGQSGKVGKILRETNIPCDKIIYPTCKGLSNEELHNAEKLAKEFPELYDVLVCKEVVQPYPYFSYYKNLCDYNVDYVRLRTLEMIAEEVENNQTKGEVAELGVFRGDFSKHICKLFPNRKLYLFDTFEGFDNDEAENELQKGNYDRDFIEHFKKTSEELVLSKLDRVDNTIIMKGLFPQSLNGLEEKFAFVSIDVDFEQSIYDGLSYFYPRMMTGGYIMIHDYNHTTLLGVKNAVLRYESENGQLRKVPIADECGSLVVIK